MSRYSDTIIADSPFAYWRLGEPSGTTADNAEGTAAYDGTYTNTPTLGVTGALTGDSDTAVTFAAASSEYVAGGGLGSLGSSYTSISVEFWIKTTSTSHSAVFVAYSSGNNQVLVLANSNGLGVSDGRIGVLSQTQAGSSVIPYTTNDTSFNDGAWHHVVCVVNATAATGQIYIDGVSQAISYNTAIAYTPANNFTDFEIAGHDGTLYFDGSLDEVAVYDYALSSGQIAEHYQVGVAERSITSLSPMALPGRRYGGFAAKTPATSEGISKAIQLIMRYRRVA